MHQLGPNVCRLAPAVNRTLELCFENDPPGRDCLREVRIFPGGPIYCQNEETQEWALAGVTAKNSRPKCGIEKFKVSSVATSTEWILKTIEALSNSV